MTTVAVLRGTVEEMLGNREDVGVHITVTQLDTAVVELTRMSHCTCDGCDQPLNLDRPGPVDWIDERTGAIQGGYSHQHGCGEWNAPEATSHEFDLDPDEEDHEEVQRVLRRLIDDLDQAVNDDVARRIEIIRRALRVQLREALDALEAGADPAEVETGSDVEPGVCREGDVWMAWNYPPLARYDGDCVTVGVAELTGGETK
ncbi:hypothetical protein [Nocardia transvalensis]|uniref:hypothetical protein n=1 Tax=Nocardia transvalensis TaxID=37333 RepID=UPI001893FBF1|nr:hypothetical protein [Nocardia transvalensis]MBF6333605.1 hypothetical protein [Nocardia transvalensis]